MPCKNLAIFLYGFSYDKDNGYLGVVIGVSRAFHLRTQLNDALIESCILNIANCTFQDVFEHYDERGALAYMDTLIGV